MFRTLEDVEDLSDELTDKAPVPIVLRKRGYGKPNHEPTTNTRRKPHLFQRQLGGKLAWICHGRGGVGFGETKDEAFSMWHDHVLRIQRGFEGRMSA